MGERTVPFALSTRDASKRPRHQNLYTGWTKDRSHVRLSTTSTRNARAIGYRSSTHENANDAKILRTNTRPRRDRTVLSTSVTRCIEERKRKKERRKKLNNARYRLLENKNFSFHTRVSTIKEREKQTLVALDNTFRENDHLAR